MQLYPPSLCFFLFVSVQTKGKVVPSMFLIKHHDMKTHGGTEVYLHPFGTSIIGGSEWSASPASRFIFGDGAPGNHCIGGRAGP
jgi:hypothetical protein